MPPSASPRCDVPRRRAAAEGANWERELGAYLPALRETAAAAKGFFDRARRQDPTLAALFSDGLAVLRSVLDPELSAVAAQELLVHHLLLAPLLRRLFPHAELLHRNASAAALERILDAARGPALDSLLEPLAPLCRTLEDAAAVAAADDKSRQTLLDQLCQRMLHGLSERSADTHGIVYTPQPLVDFMCASLQGALSTHFGCALADPRVVVMDPFTGTGNFLVNLMRRLPSAALLQKYREGLFANELLLLPCYLAALNLEYAHWAATGRYLPCTGLRRIDTFAAATAPARLDPGGIRVILGNPPYNAWQADANDNNRNPSYPGPGVAQRVRQCYGQGSRARNRSALADPYVKAFRFAAEQLGDAGIVCYVSNSGFIDGLAFDGMRRALAAEFDHIELLDLGGNVRREPQRSGAAYNVFGIQVGVCISLLVRLRQGAPEPRRAAIRYYALPTGWRRAEKYAWLNATQALSGVAMQPLIPDRFHSWLTSGLDAEFDRGLSVVCKSGADPEAAIFAMASPGLKTNRDDYAYGFTRPQVAAKMAATIDAYQAELARWQRRSDPAARSEDFLDGDRGRIAWSDTLRRKLERGVITQFDPARIRPALFRPYSRRFVYFDPDWTERRYKLPWIFPDAAAGENRAIVLSDVAMRAPFAALMTDRLPDLHLCASSDGFQCLPLYTYEEQPGGGWARKDNIRPQALAAFQRHYQDAAITREEIFYYVYALLHKPDYRQRFAANLKRELPRIPLAPDFRRFAAAGRALADLHVNYETVEPWPLVRSGPPGAPLRVEAMRLSQDGRSLRYNDTLTLAGVPKAALEYRLGHRSALHWIIDQYRQDRPYRPHRHAQLRLTEKGLVGSDPNREDDPEYILRLIGQVIAVSVKTQQLIAALPELG